MSAELASGAAADRRPAMTYTLPADTGSVWLGLDITAVTGLAVTLLATVALMLTGAALWQSLLVAATGASITTWPVGRRTLLRWIPVAAAHLSRHATRCDGWAAPADDRSPTSTRRLRLPKECGTLWLRGVGDGGPALVEDRSSHTVTVVLDVGGTGRFGLLDPAAQDLDVARWGTCLAGLLSLPGLRELQWLTHTRPDTTQSGSADRPAGGELLGADYEQLVAQVRGLALRHTHLLALTLGARGSDGCPDTSADRLPDTVCDTVRAACSRLLAADVLAYPIAAPDLPALLRLLLDPGVPVDVDGAPASSGPALLSRRNGWTSCRTDDTLHRAHAVTGWPRLALPADWLTPLLHHPPTVGTARTLTVHARPVRPEHAARRARAAGAKARLDALDRHRLGFTPSAGHDLDETDAAHTEAELLAGYPMSELSALVTVHAPSADSLDTAARDLTAWASSQRLDLRALHGQHQHALAATLPLGRIPGARR